MSKAILQTKLPYELELLVYEFDSTYLDYFRKNVLPSLESLAFLKFHFSHTHISCRFFPNQTYKWIHDKYEKHVIVFYTEA